MSTVLAQFVLSRAINIDEPDAADFDAALPALSLEKFAQDLCERINHASKDIFQTDADLVSFEKPAHNTVSVSVISSPDIKNYEHHITLTANGDGSYLVKTFETEADKNSNHPFRNDMARDARQSLVQLGQWFNRNFHNSRGMMYDVADSYGVNKRAPWYVQL